MQSLDAFEYKDQRVFLRLDLNVPMKDGRITDDSRIQASLPVINELRRRGAKIVMASHLGRPKGKPDPKFSLDPVAVRLSELLDCEVLLTESPAGDAAKGLLSSLRPQQILLLENLRFDPGEEAGSVELKGEPLKSQLTRGADSQARTPFKAPWLAAMSASLTLSTVTSFPT